MATLYGNLKPRRKGRTVRRNSFGSLSHAMAPSRISQGRAASLKSWLCCRDRRLGTTGRELLPLARPTCSRSAAKATCEMNLDPDLVDAIFAVHGVRGHWTAMPTTGVANRIYATA